MLRKPKPTYGDLIEASDGLQRPVHLPGLYSNSVGSESHLWTLDHLLSLEPSGTAIVEHYSDGDKRKRFTNVSKPFSELSELMATEPEKWFIASQDFDRMFPKVAPSLAPLPILPPDPRRLMRSAFFGFNTRSAMHFHTRDQAVLTQLRGNKTFIFTAPDSTAEIATNSPFGNRPQYSTHGPDQGEDAFESFAALVGAERVGEVQMAAGDSLFIPVHWWHWVEGDGETLSVTTFWRARAQDWSMPSPGLRSLAALSIASVVGLMRRAVDVVSRFGNRPARDGNTND